MKLGSRGFTLLEVMIALAIMAVLSLLTAQAMKSGIENRTFVSSELSRDSKLADTLRIMRNDIAQAFHYRNIYCDFEKDLNATPTPQGQTQDPSLGFQQVPVTIQPVFGGNSSAGGPTPKPCPPEVTGFIGDSESLYFTTLSNVRTLRDSRESDQAKVGYYLQSCKSMSKNPVNTKCLFRSIGTVLDEEVEKAAPGTLLLDNVEEFKLRYLGPEREDYVETWKTGKAGDTISKDKFPYAVEITLTIHDKGNPKDRAATQTVLAPISFQNNPKKKKAATTSPNATPPPKRP